MTTTPAARPIAAPAVRIAMWSGPRNISTALLRSWGSRPDTAVSDEPLYAHYLSTLAPGARAQHPAADEVMKSQPTNWRPVVAGLLGAVPRGRPIWYQKHMAHHLTPGMDLAWIGELRNALLVRDPEEMITSFIKVIPNPSPRDLGLPQQAELFELMRVRAGVAPPVLDARDVLTDPRGSLLRLCMALGVPFSEAMLAWAPGPRETDGVWGPHWYGRVYESTGFERYQPKPDRVPSRLAGVLRDCRALYEHLRGAGGLPVLEGGATC